MSDAPASREPSTVVRSAEVDAPTADAAAPAAAEAPEITKLDIRVGKILSIRGAPGCRRVRFVCLVFTSVISSRGERASMQANKAGQNGSV